MIVAKINAATYEIAMLWTFNYPGLIVFERRHVGVVTHFRFGFHVKFVRAHNFCYVYYIIAIF